ncbi:MAG: hypothetical protein ACJ8AT_21980 [Hyalangium sp.]|uniref:hypothetical protein n=1 Tax=Hyalangium sp. TaxID=2028555 RepID=UPI00389AE571
MPEDNGFPDAKPGTAEAAPAAAPQKKLRRPVEEVREELMANEEVRKQAKLLKLSLTAYVEKILDYAQNPEKPPEVYVVTDAELKARDPSIPSTMEIHDYIQSIARGEVVISPAHQRDGYAEDSSQQRYQTALGTAETPKGAPEDASTSRNPKKAP